MRNRKGNRAKSCSNLYLHLQVVIELPYIFVQSLIYGVLVYAMIGFEWTAAKFFWFFFISYFSFLYFTYYGMMTVSISPNHEVAAIFAAAFYSLFNLFSGFFIPRPVSCFFNQHSRDPFLSDEKENLCFFPPSILVSENSQMVDLVLLDLPIGMDSVWAHRDTIRRPAKLHHSPWRRQADD